MNDEDLRRLATGELWVDDQFANSTIRELAQELIRLREQLMTQSELHARAAAIEVMLSGYTDEEIRAALPTRRR